MSLETVTFELPEESLRTVDEIAENLGVDRGTALTEAVAFYLADYDQMKSELDEAEQQIDSGHYVTQEEMEARVERRFHQTQTADAA